MGVKQNGVILTPPPHGSTNVLDRWCHDDVSNVERQIKLVFLFFFRFHSVFKSLADSEESQIHVLKMVCELWTNHQQVQKNNKKSPLLSSKWWLRINSKYRSGYETNDFSWRRSEYTDRTGSSQNRQLLQLRRDSLFLTNDRTSDINILKDYWYRHQLIIIIIYGLI